MSKSRRQFSAKPRPACPTDQGSQFTSCEFTRTHRDAGAHLSIDGNGRWKDNVMTERFWLSLKHECLYLREIGTGREFR